MTAVQTDSCIGAKGTVVSVCLGHAAHGAGEGMVLRVHILGGFCPLVVIHAAVAHLTAAVHAGEGIIFAACVLMGLQRLMAPGAVVGVGMDIHPGVIVAGDGIAVVQVRVEHVIAGVFRLTEVAHPGGGAGCLMLSLLSLAAATEALVPVMGIIVVQ